jgi:hypothetical protein
VFQTLPGASFIVNGATPRKNSALTSAGAELGPLGAEPRFVDKEDYRQMLSQRGGEGGAIDDW